ncbi:hypothetical protein [Paraburkholderia sp. BR14262]
MGGRFVGLPHWVMLDQAFRAASARARSLLFDVAMQYNGRNNGRLVVCDKVLKPIGWNSRDGITKAKTELIALGLLVETRKGAKPNRAAWYALSWRPLDSAEGFDINPRSYVMLGTRKNTSMPTQNGVAGIASRPPQHGLEGVEIRPPHGQEDSNARPPHGRIPVVSAPSPRPPHGQYLDVAIPSAQATEVAE